MERQEDRARACSNCCVRVRVKVQIRYAQPQNSEVLQPLHVAGFLLWQRPRLTAEAPSILLKSVSNLLSSVLQQSDVDSSSSYQNNVMTSCDSSHSPQTCFFAGVSSRCSARSLME